MSSRVSGFLQLKKICLIKPSVSFWLTPKQETKQVNSDFMVDIPGLKLTTQQFSELNCIKHWGISLTLPALCLHLQSSFMLTSNEAQLSTSQEKVSIRSNKYVNHLLLK